MNTNPFNLKPFEYLLLEEKEMLAQDLANELGESLDPLDEPVKDVNILIIEGRVENKRDLQKALRGNKIVRAYFYVNMPEDEKKRLKTERRLLFHLRQENGFDPLETAHFLIENYPEYTYSGYAYRAIVLDEGQTFQLDWVNPGSSWALSPQGRDNFLKNDQGDRDVTYLEGNIVGINVVRLIKEKFPHILDIRPEYQRFILEDEIIAVEIIGVDKIN